MTEAGVPLKEAVVCVLGYAFLPDSDDDRNTPTELLLKELANRGIAFKLHDTLISRNNGYRFEPDIETALQNCDAVVIMTAHGAYKSLTPELLNGFMRNRIIIDGRNLLDSGAFLAEGYTFKGVGKGNLNSKRLIEAETTMSLTGENEQAGS